MYEKPREPLSVSGVIDDAIKLYRESFRRCAPVAVLGAMVSVALEVFIVIYARRAGLPLTGIEVFTQTYQEPPIVALSLLRSVLLLALFGAMIVTQNAVASGDDTLTPVQAITLGFARLGRCVVAAVVSTVLIVVGCLLIVPGIYLSSALALWPVTLYVEDAAGIQSLDESRKLIKGQWWHASMVLGVALLVVLAVSMLAGLIAGVAELSGGSGALGQSLVQLVSAIADVIMLPMLPASLIALYDDLKLRRASTPRGT